VTHTTPRASDSVRRTSSIDTTFPDGLGGRVVVHLRGRDLHTDAGGHGAVLDELALTLEVEPWSATIAGIEVTVASVSLDGLPGLPFRGLRRRLSDLFPDDAIRRTLCFSVLEDLGGAYLVSGYAGLRTGHIRSTPEVAELAVQMQGDICLGWALDGPVIETLRRTGTHAVPVGPAAPVLEDGDALAWHELPALSPQSVRRRRRTDVSKPGRDDARRIEHHFRDSYAGVDGEEVMHEYVVDAAVDDARRIISIDAEARVLPWYECPGAIATAQRVVGVELDALAARVTSEFAGVTTCTHLNSTLRTLADASGLDRSLT
jgi:hypothetical protein